MVKTLFKLISKSYGLIIGKHTENPATSFSRKLRNDSRFPVCMTVKLSGLAHSSHSLVQSSSFQKIKEIRQLPIAPTRFSARLSVSFSPETLAEAG